MYTYIYIYIYVQIYIYIYIYIYPPHDAATPSRPLSSSSLFRVNRLSNTTCLNTCFLQKWRIMQQIPLALLDK